MSNEALIADTNRLLQRLLDIQQENKERAEKSRVEFAARMEERNSKQEEAMKARLREQGLPPEGLKGSDEDWDARRKAALQSTQERIEHYSRKDEEYKVQLLQELRAQSDLLRQIAEKLGR